MEWITGLAVLAVAVGILNLADVTFEWLKRGVQWCLNRGKKSQ